MYWKKYSQNLNSNTIINIVDDDVAEEGLGKLMTFGTMLFLLGTSGMVNASELRNNLQSIVKDKQVEGGRIL